MNTNFNKKRKLPPFSCRYMSQQLKNKFDHFAEAIFPTLIALIPNSAKIMSTAGTSCIRFVIQVSWLKIIILYYSFCWLVLSLFVCVLCFVCAYVCVCVCVCMYVRPIPHWSQTCNDRFESGPSQNSCFILAEYLQISLDSCSLVLYI